MLVGSPVRENKQVSNIPQWWVIDQNDRVLAGPFTSEEDAEPVISWVAVLDRDAPGADAAAYGVRLQDDTLARTEPPQWWIVDPDDRVLHGPYASEEAAGEAALWHEATVWDEETQSFPPSTDKAEYGVRRPDGTLKRRSPPPELPHWWVIDRNDGVLVGPFTSEENAEAAVTWVKTAAPFKVDAGPEAVTAAYGVRQRSDTLEHWSPPRRLDG